MSGGAAGRAALGVRLGGGVWLFLGPALALMLAAYLAPLFDTAIISLHPNTPAGIDRSQWTGANFLRLVDSYYWGVLVRTLRVSIIITALSVVLAYPVAVWLAGLSPRAQAWSILVYMSPWFVNAVVKSFGWTLILGNNGLVNNGLRGLGLIDTPIRLMLNETGIVIGLLPGHFLFVLLPLWAALKGLDGNLRWAAMTLGARPWQVFWRVTVPLTLPALLAGAIINFTMNMAAFAAPALLGGTRTRVLSFIAYQVNLEELNWPFGGALAVAMLVVTLGFVLLAQGITARGLAGPRR
ncbi:putative spermidine/putrescine transport system permease protein [Stella humosa]|uniref:Putative spermidine/putrescine transport system permease protein n=1 Tax=Stella humosa TaxID=94 RepID=A0A3N1LKC9_9PROT|nr:ABC transporter permease [Stella humosa]ROP90886.1 putative spermidine/putrescine transport system permease protein [Stella humosa]